MQINILQRNTLRVTRSSDTFYSHPLPEMTAFWMELNHAEVEPHAGAFSIKTVFSGSERYDFPRRSVWVRPGQTLLVNAGETYASVIDRPSQSLSVFYLKSDVASAARALTASTEDLLTCPADDGKPPKVAQIALEADIRLRQALNTLARVLNRSESEVADCAARQALIAALRNSLRIAPPKALSDIVKRSTRDELLARVLRARSAIYDCQGADLTLDDLAEIACLSKYHFLRVFSEAFGETPLAFARRIRLEAAKRALERGDPLPAVARRAGFRNLPAFTRALRRTFGTAAKGKPSL